MRFMAKVGGAVLGAVLASGCGSAGVELEQGIHTEPPVLLADNGPGEVTAPVAGPREFQRSLRPTTIIDGVIFEYVSRTPEAPYTPPEENGGTGGGTDGGTEEPELPEEPTVVEGPYCFILTSAQDFSFVLASLESDATITGVTVTNLATGREIGLRRPNEPSNCPENITGYKVEGLTGTELEVCIETSEAIDPADLVLQTKSGLNCQTW